MEHISSEEIRNLVEGIESIYANARFFVVDQTEAHPAHRDLVAQIRDRAASLLAPYVEPDYFDKRQDS